MVVGDVVLLQPRPLVELQVLHVLGHLLGEERGRGGEGGATSEPMASKLKKNKYIQWFNVRPHPLGVLHLGRVVGQHFRRFPGREKFQIKN